MSLASKKVAIIGCGQSGLVNGKYLRQYGIDAIIFEERSSLGGIWSQNSIANPLATKTMSSSKIPWSSLRTNISKYSCSFSDFPWPKESSIFPSKNDMFHYFHRYAETFDLMSMIRFNCRVTIVERKSTKYALTYETLGDIVTEEFDDVIVTSGFFTDPVFPPIPDLNSYCETGFVIHSKDYICAEPFRDKNVVIIGASHSSCEVSAEICLVAKSVKVIAPRSIYALPRFLPISPEEQSPMIPLDLLFYDLDNRRIESLKQYVVNNPDAKIRGIEEVVKSPESILASKEYMNRLTGQNDIDIIPIFVAISDDYDSMVRSGLIQIIHGRLESITDSRTLIISSDDKTTELNDIDCVIFCTGYSPSLEYLDDSIRLVVNYRKDDSFMPLVLYRDILHPDIPNLYFAGMYRGPYMAIVELQAMIIAKLISGKLTIPRELLDKGLEVSEKIRNISPRPQFPHGDYVGLFFDLLNLHGDLTESFVSNLESGQILASYMISHDNTIRDEIKDYLSRLRDGYTMTAIILSRIKGIWASTSSNTRIRFQSDTNVNMNVSDILVCTFATECSIEPSNPLKYVIDHQWAYVPAIDSIQSNPISQSNQTGYENDCNLQFRLTDGEWKAVIKQDEKSLYFVLVRFQGCYIDSLDFHCIAITDEKISFRRPCDLKLNK